jgi:hypothetical protein
MNWRTESVVSDRVSKPRISVYERNARGEQYWICRWRGCNAIGKTPQQAYKKWFEFWEPNYLTHNPDM